MTDQATFAVKGKGVLVYGQEGDNRRYRVIDVDSQGRIVLSPDGGLIDIVAAIAAVDSTARKRQAGREQIFQKAITSAANAGAVTLATITTRACLIKSITVKAVTAAQTALTSAAVTGGASSVISFLDAVDAAKANIDAVDEQISWQGRVELAAAKTIVMTLVGTGATAVNLLVTFEYVACVDGGYLA